MQIVIWSMIVGVIVILLASAIRTVRPVERGLVERFGKYNRFANPGLLFIIPFGIEKLYRVNITEQMVSSEKREIITSDSLNAIVDSNIYFKVKPEEENVKASTYGVFDYRVQIVALAKTTLRNIIGTLTLRQANSERDRINAQLYELLAKETSHWGIEIVRTELKEIVPPPAVQEVMNSVVVASNKRVAAQDFATATETEADGIRRSTIKKAEGERQSVILKAEGEAQAIKLVNEAAQTYFKNEAQVLKQLEVAQAALANNSKIVIPAGQTLVNVIGDLAGITRK